MAARTYSDTKRGGRGTDWLGGLAAVRRYGPYVVPFGAVVAGYLLVRRLRRASNPQRMMEAAYDKIEVYDKTLFIDEPTAKLYAERLYAAMNQIGTDTETIFTVLDSLRSRSDLLAVQKAFGARWYGLTSANGSWVGKMTGLSKALDLNGWLREELSGGDMRRVERIYQRLGQSI